MGQLFDAEHGLQSQIRWHPAQPSGSVEAKENLASFSFDPPTVILNLNSLQVTRSDKCFRTKLRSDLWTRSRIMKWIPAETVCQWSDLKNCSYVRTSFGSCQNPGSRSLDQLKLSDWRLRQSWEPAAASTSSLLHIEAWTSFSLSCFGIKSLNLVIFSGWQKADLVIDLIWFLEFWSDWKITEFKSKVGTWLFSSSPEQISSGCPGWQRLRALNIHPYKPTVEALFSDDLRLRTSEMHGCWYLLACPVAFTMHMH